MLPNDSNKRKMISTSTIGMLLAATAAAASSDHHALHLARAMAAVSQRDAVRSPAAEPMKSVVLDGAGVLEASRDGRFVNVSVKSFRQILEGSVRHPPHDGEGHHQASGSASGARAPAADAHASLVNAKTIAETRLVDERRRQP